MCPKYDFFTFVQKLFEGNSMNMTKASMEMNSIGAKAVIAIIITTIISMFLPLDAPAPNQNDAAHFLMNDAGSYALGWINQIAAMLALSFVIAVAAWQVIKEAPARAMISISFTLMATMSFFIVKFINAWSVPFMAKALASGAPESATAELFLTSLSPAVAFGIGPSLDYLGFALYAVACLVIVRPLYRVSISAKIAAIGFLLFGLIYFLVIIAPYFYLLGQSDMEGMVTVSALPLLISCIALYFRFREESK